MESVESIIRNKELIIFDLDGTIVNSLNHNIFALKSLNQPLKKNINKTEFSSYISMGAEFIIKEYIGNHNTTQFLTLFRQNYSKITLKESEIYKGFIDFYSYLRKNSQKIAICTNKPSFLTKAIVSQIEFLKFDFSVYGDSYEYKKPDKRMLTKITNGLDINKNKAVFIGDSNIDKQTAINANIDFIAFNMGLDIVDHYYNFNSYNDLLSDEYD